MAKRKDGEPEKPKKSRKPRIPKDQQVVPIDGAEFEVDGPDAQVIAELMQDSLEHQLETSRRHKTRKQMVQAVVCTMEEYFRNFIIIGFDLSNEPVVVSRAMSPLDGEALSGLMKKFYGDWSKSH